MEKLKAGVCVASRCVACVPVAKLLAPVWRQVDPEVWFLDRHRRGKIRLEEGQAFLALVAFGSREKFLRHSSSNPPLYSWNILGRGGGLLTEKGGRFSDPNDKPDADGQPYLTIPFTSQGSQNFGLVEMNNRDFRNQSTHREAKWARHSFTLSFLFYL